MEKNTAKIKDKKLTEKRVREITREEILKYMAVGQPQFKLIKKD